MEFSPPTVRRRFPTRDPLFCRMSLDQPLTVLRMPGGSYVSVEIPTEDQLQAAEVIYLGGHTYAVSDTEAADLTAAGYEVSV